MRFLPILLVVGLLAGSAAAFAVTENLKLERSPIFLTKVDKRLAPGCRCPRKRASIGFRLRHTDHVSVAVVDGSGNVVRELVPTRRLRKGTHAFSWNGRDDSGQVVPDGTYKPRVHLSGSHRTILLPNPMLVDTAAPTIKVSGVSVRVISPDGDNRHDYVKVAYRASEDVRALMYANGNLVAKLKFYRARSKTVWPRTLLVPPRAGRYRVVLRAEDRAGNIGRPSRPFTIRVRYIELGRHVIRAPADGRFAVHVSTDASRYHWQIGSRHGRARARRLSLLAGAPGRYVLVVSALGHSDRAILIVG